MTGDEFRRVVDCTVSALVARLGADQCEVTRYDSGPDHVRVTSRGAAAMFGTAFRFRHLVPHARVAVQFSGEPADAFRLTRAMLAIVDATDGFNSAFGELQVEL
jgi:hypothetical protein